MYVEVKSAKMKCSVFPTKHLLGVCQQTRFAPNFSCLRWEKTPPDRDVGKICWKMFYLRFS